MNRQISELLGLFKRYGVRDSQLDNMSSYVPCEHYALAKIDVSSPTDALDNVKSEVNQLTQCGYDIESFVSNILLINIHDSLQAFETAIGQLLQTNLVSALTMGNTSYVGLYGGDDRVHFGHLTDISSSLHQLLEMPYGSIKHNA